MNELNVTMVGNVVTDVALRQTPRGHSVASFRIACTPRRFDQGSGSWLDGDTSFLSVSCWRGLASNVAQSVVKGMPVVVTGRLRVREVLREVAGQSTRTYFTEVEAVTVGPDLSRGTAVFTRTKREAVARAEAQAVSIALSSVAPATAARDTAIDAAAGTPVRVRLLADPETGELIEVPDSGARAAIAAVGELAETMLRDRDVDAEKIRAA